MVVEWYLVVCCVTCVYGHVITELDYRTNEIQGETEEPQEFWGSGSEVDGSHGVGRAGSKDMLYPILIGVAAKIMATIPLFLTILALMAGYSLATSKASLLLGGLLMIRHYLSEGNFLTPVAKHWKHLAPDWAHHGYHGYPGLGYHRDRDDRRPDLQLTD